MSVESVKPQPLLILVVDDDPGSRLLMRVSLQKAGYRVAEAGDGLEALEAFERLKPDALLLDVLMPRMDGYETCRAIRQTTLGQYRPILMVTGLDDVEAIHHAFDSGATDFITKPINWAVLGYRLKYMLRASDAFNDVVAKKKQIQELAFFDHLTGLANRKLFKDTLDDALAQSARDGTQLAVLFMDLDRFKTVNDTLGHHIGDYLLKEVAERVSSCIRETDTFSRAIKKKAKRYISRMGGDEFTLMLPGLKDPEDAGRVAQRINEALAEPFILEGTEVFISTSIGISVYPHDGTNAEELMKHADLAMYAVKARGRNNFQFFRTDLDSKARERLEFENDLRKAVGSEEFVLYYQPQIDLANGQIIGAEALSRWHHPDRGDVPPQDFVPAIEELGLITPFTDWVFRRAGLDHCLWRNCGCPPLRIAVNISSKQFLHQKIADKIASIASTYSFSPEFLELELTESVLAERNTQVLDTLQRIKNMGLRLSVDDFGTGYSSLVYLKAFPLDRIKIDRFFIKDILTSPQDTAIVRAIIAMAHSMDMKVIAEGIETKEQFELLRELGCDYGQGFFFSPAVNIDDLASMFCPHRAASGPSISAVVLADS